MGIQSKQKSRRIRIVALTLAVIALLLCMSGCKKKTASDPFQDMTLTQILDKLYETADLELPALTTTVITAENQAYYLGDGAISYKDAIASEPLINAIAYSVCLVRLNSAGDSESVQKSIRENVNPNKWICVGVEEQNVIVSGAGDVVILIMSDQASALKAAFDKIITAS